MRSRMEREDRLIQRLQAGDESALEEIINQYTAYVGCIVGNILRGKCSEDDAKEAVSDSFYALWQNAGKLWPGKLKAYLGAIARSRALNALRRADRAEPLEDDRLEIAVPGPEEETLRRDAYAALRRSLQAMEEPDRTIFLRHYYLYQTAAQIGRDMGINLNTVHTKLRRGRERLKAELEKGGYFIEDDDF